MRSPETEVDSWRGSSRQQNAQVVRQPSQRTCRAEIRRSDEAHRSAIKNVKAAPTRVEDGITAFGQQRLTVAGFYLTMGEYLSADDEGGTEPVESFDKLRSSAATGPAKHCRAGRSPRQGVVSA